MFFKIFSKKEPEDETSSVSYQIGKSGEEAVIKALGEDIPGERYLVSDLLFESNDGKSAQIDHVFVNGNGLFVIETKNYHGVIYGSKDDDEWTQSLAEGKTVNKFYNPVKQNEIHIKRLKKLLPAGTPIKNIVVFTSADITSVACSETVNVAGLVKTVSEGSANAFSKRKINSLYKRLLKIKNESSVTDKEHVGKIKKNKENLEKNICPACGKKLVLRKGPEGLYYGCADSPKCRFTKKYEDIDLKTGRF